MTRIRQSCQSATRRSDFDPTFSYNNRTATDRLSIVLSHIDNKSVETQESDYGSTGIDEDSFEEPPIMANPMSAISAGCLRRVFAGENVVDPIVQCVQIKPMQSQANGTERFRVVFNDTVNFIQSMIAQRKRNIETAEMLAGTDMVQNQTTLYMRASSRKDQSVN